MWPQNSATTKALLEGAQALVQLILPQCFLLFLI
jgi:hypothetical protein